ncbi:MAG: 50S ribosomal protein L32 [Bacilli bacterium]|nr:50S ribosomal protein L32 [Bacilli bacterium]
MGAIAPVRRISKTRKRKRRTHYKIEVPGMTLCPNCGEMKLAHTVCKACGYYDGRKVLEIKTKEAEEEKVEEAKPAKKTRRTTLKDAE